MVSNGLSGGGLKKNILKKDILGTPSADAYNVHFN